MVSLSNSSRTGETGCMKNSGERQGPKWRWKHRGIPYISGKEKAAFPVQPGKAELGLLFSWDALHLCRCTHTHLQCPISQGCYKNKSEKKDEGTIQALKPSAETHRFHCCYHSCVHNINVHLFWAPTWWDGTHLDTGARQNISSIIPWLCHFLNKAHTDLTLSFFFYRMGICLPPYHRKDVLDKHWSVPTKSNLN